MHIITDTSSKPVQEGESYELVKEKLHAVSDPKLEKTDGIQLKENEKQLQAERKELERSQAENETSNIEIAGGKGEDQKPLSEKQNIDNVMMEPVPASVATEPNDGGIESKGTEEWKTAEAEKREEQKLVNGKHEKQNGNEVEAQSDTSYKKATAVTTMDSSKEFEENAAENQSHDTKTNKQEQGLEKEKHRKTTGVKCNEVTPSKHNLVLLKVSSV